jgi:hypothetical protein
MITLNGKNFATSKKEFETSKSDPSGLCVGIARVRHRSIDLLSPEGEKVGVINHNGVCASATKLDNGKWWYSYREPDLVGRWESHMTQVQECQAALELTPDRILKRAIHAQHLKAIQTNFAAG